MRLTTVDLIPRVGETPNTPENVWLVTSIEKIAFDVCKKKILSYISIDKHWCEVYQYCPHEGFFSHKNYS